MNIYDRTKEFAEELKACDEVVTLQKLSQSIKDSEEYKKLLSDFRKIQVKAYSQQVQDGKISEEVMEKFKSMGSVISANPPVNEYIQAEQKFSVLWQNILKILNDAIGIDFSFGEDKNRVNVK
ncbi:YlbF family regulator [Clostridium luticellarii]|jgi:cell fate (sporulation/competence/biofilm development) regulator YlbF (YheA/YmcA/DUF963 family)|uniref:Uncharacterized protein n=1 Tax=Clostridium luticellarii TaxID=1691940 RepID=A0A2T0BRK3_9CLOT|nr:YlbF family regulator [Clostridium luticellarii]MCI1943818.1 YlbF family regulator [Clostridium luticellarii]MCI1967079.1 YlbF family regulator [Clostridium luticellarii]MCI1994446.1 YlbF family regulator [Clostridium luticellarii]MCI2038601.1 YlbF family regulator [Clostridium luticellarii]PRR86475.1 hypothetical protein CLLU_05730 [Clostridium luticellarii]